MQSDAWWVLVNADVDETILRVRMGHPVGEAVLVFSSREMAESYLAESASRDDRPRATLTTLTWRPSMDEFNALLQEALTSKPAVEYFLVDHRPGDTWPHPSIHSIRGYLSACDTRSEDSMRDSRLPV